MFEAEYMPKIIKGIRRFSLNAYVCYGISPKTKGHYRFISIEFFKFATIAHNRMINIKMIRFILILALFFAYTCFKAIQLNPLHQYTMILISFIFFSSMLGSMFISRSKPGVFETPWFIVLTWVGSTFMGFWGTYILIAIPIDIVAIIYSFFNHGVSFLTPNAHWGIFLLSIAMTSLGLLSVVRGPKVLKVDIPNPDLPDGLKDLKIAQISDLHIGPTIQGRYVRRVVAQTNALDADIIVITGDLVDAHTESIKMHLQPLADLKSHYGVYYVTGNHEYYWGIESLLGELEKVGLIILENNNRVIDINGSQLMIAGIPDPMAIQLGKHHKPDVKKARLTPAKTDFNILLTHRPDPYLLAEEQGFHLQFSGHTHAGQFFPFSLLIPLAHKYYRGLNRIGKMWLYVNPGTGYWGPANRFGVTSEITLAKLIKA